MVTEAIRSRMVWVITGVLALLVLLALPAKAESADYETTLDRLGRLQALAEQYIEEKNSGDDPIDLTLSFTRVGDYNTDIWQLTAGTRDGEFEKYATDADPDLWDLQGMNTVELPNGQGIDFGHLLAAMNLVYRGMPIAGSWGGDCMQLAQVYAGQASDADGYASLMQQTFAIGLRCGRVRAEKRQQRCRCAAELLHQPDGLRPLLPVYCHELWQHEHQRQRSVPQQGVQHHDGGCRHAAAAV